LSPEGGIGATQLQSLDAATEADENRSFHPVQVLRIARPEAGRVAGAVRLSELPRRKSTIVCDGGRRSWVDADEPSARLWFSGRDLLAGLREWVANRGVANQGASRALLGDWIIAQPERMLGMALSATWRRRCWKAKDVRLVDCTVLGEKIYIGGEIGGYPRLEFSRAHLLDQFGTLVSSCLLSRGEHGEGG
jgi:hypothetical protein